MAEAASAKKRYTYEDYLKTPDDERYELIEGDMFMTPSPETDHQRISRELEFKMIRFVKENDLDEVFDAPYDVYLNDEDVVQPDILFVSKERLNIIDEDKLKWPLEIISEGTAYRDTIQKKMLYARFGVKGYWLVATKERMAEVYIPKG